jgi:predicted component of type VI protein secretion system
VAFDEMTATAMREVARLEREIARLREALESIHRYGLDTLSGRVDGPDDRDWQRAGINEMTKRARLALEGAADAESPARGGRQG